MHNNTHTFHERVYNLRMRVCCSMSRMPFAHHTVADLTDLAFEVRFRTPGSHACLALTCDMCVRPERAVFSGIIVC